MHKPITDDELMAHDGISPKDKELIAKVVSEYYDSSEEPDRVNALRGYLVGLCDEAGLDDELRAELETVAADWSDGWDYCLEYGGGSP